MNTKITELLNIKYPIIQAGMIWVSGWKLASAVSNNGGLGLIGSGSMKPELLREHIQKCVAATDKPFGVNIPLMRKDVEDLVKVTISEVMSASLLQFLHFFSFIAFTFLLIYVLYTDIRSLVHKVCAVFLSCCAVWSFGMIFIHNPNSSYETVDLVYKIISLGWIGFIAILLWFVYVFVGD